jgi:hypothetical protein
VIWARMRRVAWLAPMSIGIALMLASTAAAAVSPCPNEALRSELHSGALPDCRAYEMVTPSFKEGDGVAIWAVSSDGSRVLGSSFGAFAGTESNEVQGSNGSFGEAALYLFSRGAAGWSTEPIAPAASQFPSGRLVAMSPELTSTLWLLRTPTQPFRSEAELYLRTNGTFVLVGQTQPTPGEEPDNSVIEYGGSSRSLNHVVFWTDSESGGEFLWPGDETFVSPEGRSYRSLYEYTGTGNSEPALVGVRNEGRLHGSPHLNEGAEMISECGTVLGGEGSAYNAVSASGATVFFTARAFGDEECEPTGTDVAPPINELYARLSGERTVAISEPAKADCEACNTTKGLAGALFAGASEDGSKVFFTTEQELLPGAKGNNLYEYDFAAAGASPEHPDGRITLVSAGASPAGVLGVARISEDGSHVYYVASGALTGANAEGHSPVIGHDNLYCYETLTGRTQFIGTLLAGDARIWGRTDHYRPIETTPDGDFLVFTSVADLTAGDTSTVAQVFEYDAQDERLQRVSVGQDGYDGNGNTSVEADAASLGTEATLPVFVGGITSSKHSASRALANDGSRVFFESADALTPQTVAGLPNNVYEWEREGAGSCPVGQQEGCVYLISDGRDDSTTVEGASVRLIATDESGEDVFFNTADQLLPARDTDTEVDLYDARVGGGFEEPRVTPECVASSCQQPLALSSPAPTIQTATGASEAPQPAPTSKPAPAPKPPARAQEYAKALAKCHAEKAGARRRACEVQARKRYGPVARPSQAHRRGRR